MSCGPGAVWPPSAWGMIETHNPATGELLARYEETSPEAVIAAIEAADGAQQVWAQTDLAERAIPMRRFAEILEERIEPLAELMADEMGKPLAQGRGEVEKCAWVCRHYADEAPRILADEHYEVDRKKSYTAWRPMGIVLAVMPWNFPLWQVIRFVAPALMAGNAGLLKHASNVTGTALAIDEMVTAAGFPDGLFRTLVLPARRVDEVLEHPLVRAATLTGSDPAGRAVASKAGSLLKKTVLELGGSDPYLVLADADIDLAASSCATSRLINGGQSCVAAKRFIVDRTVVDEFTEKLIANLTTAVVGDPKDPNTTLGPLARTDLRDELHDQVVRSVRDGAELLLGGEVPDEPGSYYPPTVLGSVTEGMAVYHEETFGPVATIIPVDGQEEAIEVANSSEFGLGAGVFTRDEALGESIARDRLEAGNCFVNSFVASDPRLPFGGVKMSGYGRELSDLGMREFMNAKTVVVT